MSPEWPGNRIVGKEGGTVDDLLPAVQSALVEGEAAKKMWEKLKVLLGQEGHGGSACRNWVLSKMTELEQSGG